MPVFVRIENKDKVVNGIIVFNRVLEFGFDEDIAFKMMKEISYEDN